MNPKQGLLVTVIALFVFLAVVEPTSPDEYLIGKQTLEMPSGVINDSRTYCPGDTVYYRITYTPTSEDVTITRAEDELPDGTSALLPAPAGLSYPFVLAKNASITWETSWVVPLDWASDKITNRATIYNFDQFGTSGLAIASRTSTIKPALPKVPTLTPIGIIGLVGLLSIIAISKLRRRGR